MEGIGLRAALMQQDKNKNMGSQSLTGGPTVGSAAWNATNFISEELILSIVILIQQIQMHQIHMMEKIHHMALMLQRQLVQRMTAQG